MARLGAEQSMSKNFIAENEKRTNKVNDKPDDSDYLIHNTTSHSQSLYKTLSILAAVVTANL